MHHEYAVGLKIGNTEPLILSSTVHSSYHAVCDNLRQVRNDIRNGMYADNTAAELMMRNVSNWCETTED